MSIRHKVYLAGPVTGFRMHEAWDWRNEADSQLTLYNIDSINPMRMLSPTTPAREILQDNMEGKDAGDKTSAILARCHWDVQRCDAVLVNMEGAVVASIGTAMEIAWAVAYQKPIVIVDVPGSPHDHCMIRSSTPYFCRTLDEGMDVLYKLFM